MSGSLRGEELSGGIGLNGQDKLNVGLNRSVGLCLGLLCFHNATLGTMLLNLERPLRLHQLFLRGLGLYIAADDAQGWGSWWGRGLGVGLNPNLWIWRR
jgi:hypothetical protein